VCIVLWHVNLLLSNGRNTHTHGPTRSNRTTALCTPFLGNSSVNTLPRKCNDVTSQLLIPITWLVFSVWFAVELGFLCCPFRGYIVRVRLQLWRVQESSSWVPRFQGVWTRNVKKASWRLQVLVSVLTSIARRRLVDTENASACMTVICKMCLSAIALY
jgi:hypothetical protein